MSQPRHRSVNQALGLQPRFGPIPSDQLFPWLAITFTFYLLGNQLLHLPWLWTGLLTVWGCGTWWLLTGSRSYRFLGKFIPSPSWTRGRQRYRPLLTVIAEQEQLAQTRRQLRLQKQQQAKAKRLKASTTRTQKQSRS